MKKILLLFVCAAMAGIAGAQTNPYPVVPIDTIQYVSQAKLSLSPPNDSPDYLNPVKHNPTFGDTVRIEGYVVFNPRLYGLSTSRKSTYIMADTFGRAWSGVEVMADGPALGSGPGGGVTTPNLITESKFYDNMVYGTKVRVTGRYSQFQGNTQLYVLRASPNWDQFVEILNLTPKKLTPAVVTIDQLQTGSVQASNKVQQKVTGEKWEGVYVEFRNVTVSSRTQSGTRWNWSVIDDSGNEIEIRDFSAYYRNDNNEDSATANNFIPPVIGSRLSYIRGAITESDVSSVRRYWLAPLYPGDLGASSYTPLGVINKTRFPVVASSNDSVLIAANFVAGTRPAKSGRLFYAVGAGTTTFTSVTMNRSIIDPNQWYAFVPKQADGSVVKYYIRATDSSDFSVNSPDTLATNSAYMVVDGGIKTIQQLQFSPYKNNATIWHNDSLNGIDVRGIVTSTGMDQGSGSNRIYFATVQNGTGPNSAVVINRSNGDATGSWKVGDSVQITACRVRENFNVTTLNFVAGNVISSGRPLPPAKRNLTIDSIALANSSSTTRTDLCPWEGQIFEYDSVYVVNKNADGTSDFGEFLINRDSSKTTGLRVDDVSTRLPDFFNGALGMKQFMKHARGVFYLSFSNWKLEPRDSNDLDFSNTPLPPDVIKPVITLNGKNPDSLLFNTSYNDPGATAMDNRDGNISGKIVRKGTVDSSVLGTYVLSYVVSDLAGNKDSVTRSVRVYKPSSVNENEWNAAQLNVYPSPASTVLQISASGYNALPVNISIADISGKIVFSKTINHKQLAEKIEVDHLTEGVYFCTIGNDKGSKTVRFVISR